MTVTQLNPSWVRHPGSPQQSPWLDIVVPAHNEQAGLETAIRRLHGYLTCCFPLGWRITVADSASTDATWSIACRLAEELPGIRLVRLTHKGRGRALRAAWQSSEAAVLAYMDVDLSTDLAALLPLVAPLLSGHSDLAIGTRLARGSRVVRGPKREMISRAYNTILHGVLRAGFTDAQCGFKAIRRDRAEAILPAVQDEAWFFDTELLVLAERAGLRIHEVPVDWVDDPSSTVDIVATAREDLLGVARLLRGATLTRQIGRFAAIGLLSTVLYVAIYAFLRVAMNPFSANAAALAVTAVANTAANRRLTFGVSRRERMFREQLQGLGVFGLALALTSSALGMLHMLRPDPARWVEISVLLVATVTASAVRFVLLRHWVFRAAPTARTTG
jgi:putative flippase GtrA